MEPHKVLSVQAAAHLVKEALNNQPLTRFTARPWNRYSSEDSLWWLVPSKEWPAYRHAKIVLYKDSGAFCIGMHFEKGFNRIAAEYIDKKKHRFILESDWALHRIFSDISAGLYGERLNNISKDLGRALQLRVYATVFSDLDADNQTQPRIQDSIRFRVDPSGLGSPESQQAGILGQYQNMGNLKDLPKLLEDEVLYYYWLDFHVVFEVPYANQSQLAACAEAFLEHYPEVFQ